MPLDPRRVYRVRSEQDPTAVLALDAREQGDHVTWFDTSRDRGHRVSARREEGGRLVYETEQGFTYSFEPLTKAIYDAEVRDLVELAPEFEDDAALSAFYLRNFLGIEPDAAPKMRKDRS